MKITVKVATTETASKSVHFDRNALLMLENTAIGTPVTENFDFDKKVGAVLSAKLQEDGLFVECEIKEGVLDKLNPLKVYLAPAFTLPDFKCFGFGLTTNPADITLPHIEI
jgi:hypothetical protein